MDQRREGEGDILSIDSIDMENNLKRYQYPIPNIRSVDEIIVLIQFTFEDRYIRFQLEYAISANKNGKNSSNP